MNKAKLRREFDLLYKSLTDPEVIAENKRRADRKKRLEDKRADTGL